MKTTFDHLVIGAADLRQGSDYVENCLGVQIPAGGKHPRMATHNLVARLGEKSFIEIIAIDPDARQPTQPRWFGLDDPHVRANLEQSPRLLTWVVACDDITAALDAPEIAFGTPQPLSRGELRWYFGVPDDGRLLAGGILPCVISWQTESHPAAAMADIGLDLRLLRLHTPFVDWTARQLEAIGALEMVELIEAPPPRSPRLEAVFATPAGERTLSSRS